MTKKSYPDVKDGQVWRDLNPRNWYGIRRVEVMLLAFGYVTYQQVVGANNEKNGRLFRSRMERFQRAFELIKEPKQEVCK